MNALPFFTVIVPTHLRAHLLRRTLESIRRQDFERLQVIVVSDVADAATATACQELLGPRDMFVQRSGPCGPSESRNIGLMHALGQYVLFIDDDDAYQDGFFAKLHAALSQQPREVVYVDCVVVNERRVTGDMPVRLSEARVDMSGRYNEQIFVKNNVHMSCIAFARLLLQGLRFDIHMRAYEDWDFMLAAMKNAQVEHLPIDGSYVYEVHDETTDRRGASSAAQNYNAVVDYLYVYRRHPAPSEALREARHRLLASCAMNVPSYCL